MGGKGPGHDALLAELTRRGFLARGSLLGLGALAAGALPWASHVPSAAASTSASASGSPLSVADATMQAFADTMVPGRPAQQTESGATIDPLAIAGVDPLPGAVEADALSLYSNVDVGFTALEGAFLAELDSRSLEVGGADFLHLPFQSRVQVSLQGLDFSNPTLEVWEAAAAVPFTAFCAAALVVNATAHDAVGYAVMGLPGVAPGGYASYSYRRTLSRERTAQGSLP